MPGRAQTHGDRPAQSSILDIDGGRARCDNHGVAAICLETLRSDLVSLAHRGHDLSDFSLGAARILRRVVPFDGVCVLTLDPATLLPTGEVVDNGLPPATRKRMAEIEIAETDFNKFPVLARSQRRTATLSESTDGDLDRSLRHRELRRPAGFGDELRAALVSDSGTWGAITLLREAGRTDFTPAEADLVAALSDPIAQGLRHTIVRGTLSTVAPGYPEPAGVVVLEHDNSIVHVNAAAETWLAELLDHTPAGENVPAAVAAVASRARSAASGRSLTDARARLRTPSGLWLLIHGSTLGDGLEGRAVVILEPARAPELAPLVADAYGLTERERIVTELVAQGLGTSAIAERLHLSPWTVQDHLKAIFEKTNTSARGQLVARLFFEHFAPRLTGAAPSS
jgi:DNA-binding CsgD family transcriptional regulator